MYANNVAGIFSVINIHSIFIPFSTQVVRACKTVYDFEFMLQQFQFTWLFLTRRQPLTAKHENSVPFNVYQLCLKGKIMARYIMRSLKFSVFITTLFTILVLCVFIGLKVYLKCTSNWNFRFWEVNLLTRILARVILVMNYWQMSQSSGSYFVLQFVKVREIYV